MSASSSGVQPHDELLAEFLKAFENAPEPAEVLEKYCRLHPELADEFRDLAAAQGILGPPPAESPAAPSQLGEFRIVRPIGRGGMGEIYEAYHDRLRRRVAVKTIRQGRISPDSRARFLREQQVLARLHQTHIVPIHTAGEEGPLQYFAMPFIEGAALHHVVRTAYQLQTERPGRHTPTLGELASHAAHGGNSKSVAKPPGTVSFRPEGEKDEGLSPKTGLSSEHFTLSLEYFRSVAEVLADAAKAVDHAHIAGVLHRDLKPSNFMVDTRGQCWIIDFGLAAWIRGAAQGSQEVPAGQGPLEPTSGISGTPQYMAPEQWQGKAEVRSDVWGLGATLYELLTLRRAFDGPSDPAIRESVFSEEPQPPQRWVADVPPDLSAICRMALCKDAAGRYPSAAAFAADLPRWLRLEPTVARPARAPRRAYLWARRNPGWAVAIAVGFLSLVLGGVGGILVQGHRADVAVLGKSAAEEKAARLDAEVRAGQEREAAGRRELLLQQLQQLRLSTHQATWSESAWARVLQLKDLGGGEQLRNQAAATLNGLDAQVIKRIAHDVGTVAFDPAGDLFYSGKGNKVHVWRRRTETTDSLDLPGQPGPFAFRKDGVPVQLRRRPEEASVELWDVLGRRRLVQLPAKDLVRDDGFDWAITPDARLVGLAVDTKEGKGSVSVYDGVTGNRLHHWLYPARTLALAPDGRFAAAVGEDGIITCWSLSSGRSILTLPASHNAIHCLAFGRDPKKRDRGEPTTGWLLAAGDAGGLITIWDLTDKRLRSYCRGSNHDVFALAFHPDGTMLASSGRSFPKLWDIATGRLLLNLATKDYGVNLAFAPDGSLLAVAAPTVFGSGNMEVWRFENGRGMQSLHGLGAQVAKTLYSRDGSLLAAMAHDWHVAVWEAKTGRLLHLFETPPGYFADNAAVAFAADGRRLAWCAGTHAKLWDLMSGQLIREWNDLPPGLADQLAFHPTGKLLLFRVETNVCRIRDLLAPNPRIPLAQITDFSWNVLGTVAASDGSYFIAEGCSGPRWAGRAVTAFEGLTGNRIWSVPSQRTLDHAALVLDPSGKRLACLMNEGYERMTFVEAATGKLLGSRDLGVCCLTNGDTYSAKKGPQMHDGLSLFLRNGRDPVVIVGIDLHITSIVHSFDPAGTHLAWGNEDGTVTVCDIPLVQRRLSSVQLGLVEGRRLTKWHELEWRPRSVRRPERRPRTGENPCLLIVEPSR